MFLFAVIDLNALIRQINDKLKGTESWLLMLLVGLRGVDVA